MRYLLATVFSLLIYCLGFSQNAKSTFCNQKIEVCFLIDATGSMRPVMEDFKVSIPEVLRDIKIDWNDWDFEISAVLYRDKQDEYLTRTFEKTTNLKSFVDFMQKQYAVGGGDEQESMPAAYQDAINVIKWREGNHPKFIITFTDNDINMSADQFKAGRELGITQLLFPIKGRAGWDGETESISYLSNFMTNHINNFITDNQCYFGKEEPIIAQSLSLKVYPNPTSEIFTIDLPEGDWEIELQSTNGQTIKKSTAKDSYQENIKSLAAGTYFVKISNETISQIEKLVVVNR